VYVFRASVSAGLRSDEINIVVKYLNVSSFSRTTLLSYVVCFEEEKKPFFTGPFILLFFVGEGGG